MKKSIFTKITAIFLCVVTLLSLSAIGACAATSGGSSASTITVTSKANYLYAGASSVTLKQDKQTMTYKKLFGSGTKTKKDYFGCYDISIYNVTKNKTKSAYWGGGQTKKISLDPNCTYRITVRYNSTATVMFKSSPLGYSWKSSTAPSWRVSSTWKVSSCY